MKTQALTGEYSVLCLILRDHHASDALRIASENGLPNGTIFYASATAREKIWRILALDDVRMECIIFAGQTNDILNALDAIDAKYHFEKSDNGIAFVAPLSSLKGAQINQKSLQYEENVNGGETMFEAIVTIVDRGQSQFVIETANAAGARGGTVLHGRGTALKVRKVLNMEIEPEKEIVISIVSSDIVDEVSAAISEALKLDQPNSGILFTLSLSEVRGIR